MFGISQSRGWVNNYTTSNFAALSHVLSNLVKGQYSAYLYIIQYGESKQNELQESSVSTLCIR